MTTILCWKCKEGFFLAADSQVVEGGIKFPSEFKKLIPVNRNVVCGGAGSVGSIQQLLKISVRNLKIKKIHSDEETTSFSPKELSEELAELNFHLPLEYKSFNAFSFVIAGFDYSTETFQGFSIGEDGSLVEISKYYALGSGSHLGLSLLSEHYNLDLPSDEAAGVLFHILRKVSEIDLGSDDTEPLVYFIKSGEIIPFEIKEVQEVQEKSKPEKDKPEKPKTS